MNNRVTSDSGNPVNLFPFLAVLLCTMGALLVLLVVLADRAGKRAVAESEASQPAVAPALFQKETSQQLPSSETAEEAAELVRQLDEVHAYQQKLSELRKQADQRLLEEQQRLTHVEEHTRRMEHELARLSLAAEQLEATEQNQVVDQEQAEHELVRLQKLIEDTEAELEELREENQGQRSYAIVPYRGPNGTYRKPIYIECRKEAIILHPEGIRLKPSDFLATSWSGNPLAAALRATRDHVNAQAAKAGAPEPPDPYPMILVRPDGIRNYSLARAAITSWDASFGYEFIDSDWKLEFPEGPDPLLAQKQQHAIMLARERFARLIRSAPSRFHGIGLAGTAAGARGGTSGSNGYGEAPLTSETGESDFSEGKFSEGKQLGQSQTGNTGEGNGFAAGQSSSSQSNENGEGAETDQNSETQYGATTGGDASATGEPDATGQYAEGASQSGEGSSEGSGDADGNGGTSERYGQAGGSAGGSAGENSSSSSASGGQAAATSGNASAGGSSGSAASQTTSIADSQGRNWAVKKKSRGSVPIRRSIQVVVRQDQIALLPSRHALGGVGATSEVISLNQPMGQISNKFVAALRIHIKEWGLAGSGLYWRPMLKLNVGPGAEQTAEQVIRLLKNSGVEVSLPDTARASSGSRASDGGLYDATR